MERNVTAADVCHLVAGGVGKLWRKHRRKLPPEVRTGMAEFLLLLRLHVVPEEQLCAVDSIGKARYDIRGIAELFKFLAVRNGGSEHSSSRPTDVDRKSTAAGTRVVSFKDEPTIYRYSADGKRAASQHELELHKEKIRVQTEDEKAALKREIALQDERIKELQRSVAVDLDSLKTSLKVNLLNEMKESMDATKEAMLAELRMVNASMVEACVTACASTLAQGEEEHEVQA